MIKLEKTKSVVTLKEEFKVETGLTLRVYKGKNECDTSITLEELNIQEADISFSTKMKIGNIEDLFAKQGLKVQIALADDTKLCDNDYTLAKAKAIQLVQEDSYNLKKLSEGLRSDRDVVLEAVKDDGYALEYASKELRSSRDVVLEIIEQYPYALQYASEELRSDAELLGIYIEDLIKDYDSVEKLIRKEFGTEDGLDELGFDVDLFKKIVQKRLAGELVTLDSNKIRTDNNTTDDLEKELKGKLESLIEDIEDCDDREEVESELEKGNYWYIVYEYELGDDDLKRKLLLYEETIAITYFNFTDIANKYEQLNDNENAIRVYKLAEEKIENFNDAELLGSFVFSIDKEWAIRLYEKAYQYAIESDRLAPNLNSLAYQVYSKLKDKSWAVKLYNKALEEAKNVKQKMFTALEIMMDDNTINDKVWGKSVLKECELKALTFDELFELLEIVIREDCLNNKEWGAQIVQKLRPLLKSVEDCTKVIDKLCEHIDLTTQLFIDAILLVENEDEQEDIAYYAEEYFGYNDLTNDLKELSIEELKNKYRKWKV